MWANGSSCSSSSFAAEQRCEAAEIKILSTIAHCLRCKWNVKTGALNQTGLCGSLSWRSVPKPRAFCFGSLPDLTLTVGRCRKIHAIYATPRYWWEFPFPGFSKCHHQRHQQSRASPVSGALGKWGRQGFYQAEVVTLSWALCEWNPLFPLFGCMLNVAARSECVGLIVGSRFTAGALRWRFLVFRRDLITV